MNTARSTDPVGVERQVARGAAFLARWPGVHRVWLFGGVARGRRPDFRSDIDFAVEGMAARDLARAWSELDQVIEMPVDLVRWEEASPALRGQITEWGRVLHESPPVASGMTIPELSGGDR